MDEVIQLQPAPKYTYLYAVLAVLVLLIGGVYVYTSHLPGENESLKNSFAQVYLTPKNDGTVAWYEYNNGNLVQHPSPAQGRVTGIARANGSTYFVLVPFTRKGSTIFRFSGGAYSTVFQNTTNALNQLSVSADGTLLAFIDASTTPKATVVDTTSGKVSALVTSTILPQFLNVAGVQAVLYSSGTDLMLSVYANGDWQAPQVVYKGTGATMSLFASNRGNLFAYVDPLTAAVHEMQASALTPFAATEKATYPSLVGYSIAYGGEHLFAYHYNLQTDMGQYLHLTVADSFGGDGKTYSFAAPATLEKSTAVFLLPSL